MKARALVIICIALLAGWAGYAIAHRQMSRAQQSDLMWLQDISRLTRALDLEPDQVEALRALQQRLRDQLAVCCAQHCACRRELAAVLVAETGDQARATELLNSMCRSYADSERLALEHIRSLCDLLHPSQRARFDRMLTDALATPCGACTNCGRSCGMRNQ